jgi:hypothetical protein
VHWTMPGVWWRATWSAIGYITPTYMLAGLL